MRQKTINGNSDDDGEGHSDDDGDSVGEGDFVISCNVHC